MPRKKTIRAAALAGMPHVFIRPGSATCAPLLEFVAGGRMALDLGCGSGDTTVALAARDPARRYLGVDLKGARLHRGAEASLRLGLANVAFLVAPLLSLAALVPEGTFDEGWLFFPDPHPKRRAAKHRLTSPVHLAAYRRLFRRGASLHLRTDSEALFEYSRIMLQRSGFAVQRESTCAAPYPETEPPTTSPSRYEARFRALGRTLHFIDFQVP
jgi:tRNA (guanine-N7-)-methyltransferase